MGPIVAAIAVVAKIAAAKTIAGLLVRTALTLAASALMRALTPKPKAGGAANASGVEQQRQIGENTPRAIALGWTIVAGSEVALWASGDGDDNKFNTRAIDASDWPCTLQKVWVDGRALTFEGDINTGWFACQQYRSKAGGARLWMRFVKGDWNQAADAEMISYAAANGAWTSDDRLRGVSALLIRREYDADAFPSGAPDNASLRIEVKDAPVYDWRDVTQSVADVTTWKPSENPVVLCENALCLLRAPAQFSPGSTAPIVGPGMDFSRRPLAKLTAMANICDENVGGVPRYRAGGVVSADMTGRDIQARFAAACGGDWVSSGGGGYLRPGHVPVPTMDIPAGALSATEADDFDPWARPDATINTLIGSYPEPSNAWEIVPLPPATDVAWVTEDGGVRATTEDLSFVPYREQAWRLVTRKVRAKRLQGTRSFTGAHWLVELEPGDVVTSADLGLPFPVDTWWMVNNTVVLPRDDGVRVQLQISQIDAAIDAAAPAVGAPATFTPRAVSRALLAPALDVVQRIATGGGGQQPQIVFTLPDASSQGLAGVELRGPGASLAVLPSTGQRQTADLSRGLPVAFDVQPGFYQYRSRGRDAVGALGLPSAWVDLAEVTASVIAGDTARVGGVLAAEIIAGIAVAIGDGVYTPGEKTLNNPNLQNILSSAASVSARALALGITTERTAFDAATLALSNYLATLTLPVAWNDASGNTDVAGPATFSTVVFNALNARTLLLVKMEGIQPTLPNLLPNAQLDPVGGVATGARSIVWQDVPALPTLSRQVDGALGAFSQVTSPSLAALSPGSFYGQLLTDEQTAAAAVPLPPGLIAYRGIASFVAATGTLTAAIDTCYVRLMGYREVDGVWDTSVDIPLDPANEFLQPFEGIYDSPTRRRWTVAQWFRVRAGVAVSVGGNMLVPGFFALPPGQTLVPPWLPSSNAARGATRNRNWGPLTVAPTTGEDGDTYTNTTTNPPQAFARVSGAWVVTANNVTNTNQVTDGANLGGTSVWGPSTILGLPANLAALGGSEAIRNALISINASNQLVGIGTGSGLVVVNTAIGFDGNGAITGIGAGNGTVIDNRLINNGVNGVRDAQLSNGLTERGIITIDVPAPPLLFTYNDAGVGPVAALRTAAATTTALAYNGLIQARALTGGPSNPADPFAGAGASMGAGRVGFRQQASFAPASGTFAASIERVWARAYGFNPGTGAASGYVADSADFTLVAGLQERAWYIANVPVANDWVIVVWIVLKSGVSIQCDLNTWKPMISMMRPDQTVVPMWVAGESNALGADVTVQQVRSIVPQFPAIEIKQGEAGHTGARTITMAARRGSGSLTGGTWSLVAGGVDLGAGAASINASTGTVTLTGIVQSGKFKVRYTHTDTVQTDLDVNVMYVPTPAAGGGAVSGSSSGSTTVPATAGTWATIVDVARSSGAGIAVFTGAIDAIPLAAVRLTINGTVIYTVAAGDGKEELFAQFATVASGSNIYRIQVEGGGAGAGASISASLAVIVTSNA